MSDRVDRAYVVALTIPDNEAFTARSALTRLGLPVAEVRRADVWVANVDRDRVADLDAAVTTMETIFNPNKHRLDIRTVAVPQPGEVWVSAGEETPATTVAGRAIPGVHGILRRTAWRLLDEQGRDVAPEVLRRATAEFLCNPAFQKAFMEI
jgi:streptogramin lyase